MNVYENADFAIDLALMGLDFNSTRENLIPNKLKLNTASKKSTCKI